ncbi:DUF1992 domain-containing protein [Microbacterium sp. CFH 90308]|uniref:DUF1992 domain-containing protein n=2 Tax=Microbacterium salsuginis TaxID=2722803 RepID=A0ABX1KD07_9MICO|nr:DUF1992 domain-containing protein [Microbacterium sp. CFH 90308]
MTDHDRPAAFFNPYAVSIDAEVAIALLADLQIRRAIDRGDFDDLPGSGKPLDLSDSHDPDWWLKRLMKREGFTMLPPSIQLRNEDATLDARLDRLSSERDVRREIEEFNVRVVRARYELTAGPPLVTMPRDVDQTARSWAERRARRAAEARERQRLDDIERGKSRGRRWKRRR